MFVLKCQECGAEFLAKHKTDKFCKGPHIANCAVCGKPFEYTCRPKEKPNTCSKECKNEFRKQNLVKKYGVEYVSQIPEVREKKKISNASPEAQEKMKQTCLAKYGVERATLDPEVNAKLRASLNSEEHKAKVRATFQERYGVDHIFASKEFREAHGCNTISKLESTKQARRKSIYERYGVTCIMDIPEVKEKIKQKREATVKKKYGVPCVFQSDAFQKHLSDKYGVSNISKHPATLSKAFRNKQNKSSLELRLHNFLADREIEYIDEYVLSNGDIIHSFDVYLPKYKILVDCDGVY